MKLIIFLILSISSTIFAQEAYTSYWEKAYIIEIDWEKTPADIFILKNDDYYLFDSMKGLILATLQIDNQGKKKYSGIIKFEISDSLNTINYHRKLYERTPGYIDYFNKKIEEKLKDLHLKIEIYDLKEDHAVLMTFGFKYN